MSDGYPEAVEVSATPGTTVLFLDLLEVADMDNAQLVVNAATKHPANPVIKTGLLGAWDSLQAATWHGTVIWDDEDHIFKAWYVGIDALETSTWQTRTGYAISPDGVAWEKPSLGIHEYNGSSDNNLTIDIAPALGMGPALKDPGDPDPARRYKLFLWDDLWNTEIWNALDGVHFTREGKPSLTHKRLPDGSKARLPDPEVWFDVHQCLYDAQDPDPNRRYKYYGQISEARGDWNIRKGGLAYGPDPWTLTRSPHNPIIDPDDGNEFQIHYISVLPYKGYYLMLYEFAWLEPLYGAYVGDVRLAVSRDGEIFRRVNPHQAVIRRGEPDAWDSGIIVTSSDTVVHDDQLWLYFAGSADVWKNWPRENLRGAPPAFPYPVQTGLATLPLDGFTDIESLDHEMPGIVTTVPIRRPEARTRLALSVSNSLPGRGWVDVEVLDEAGSAIPGYERAACRHLWKDGASRPVTWADRTDLPLSVERMRLRFWTYGAVKLHGFTFVSAVDQ